MRRISMVLALALAFCMTLSACQTESIPEGSTSESLHAADVVPEDQVDLKESKELVVYRYPLLGEQLDFAVEQFKKQYPDVEIEYRDFGDASDPNASDQYAEILQGELAAGKGPDIIVAPTYAISSDFSKTEETGAFLDVRAKLMQDTELSMDMFVDRWLSIGGVGEQQCFIPLSYQTRVLFADQTVLQENGVECETLSDPVGFHSTIDRWMETKEGDMTLWDAHSYGLWLVLPWCGAEAVDYENHTLNLNDDFRNTMELYKSLYDSDMVKPQSEGWVDLYSNVYSGEAGRNLSQGMHLFLLGQENLLSLTDFRAIEEESRIMLPFPSYTGKNVAEVCDVACINATSQNTENAYNFLKILLSDNVQIRWRAFPVNKDALSSAITESTSAQYTDDMGNVLTTALTVEEKKQYTTLITENLEWHLPVAEGVSNIIWETMEPYFQNSQTYDICLQELENRLTIYLDE